MVFTTGMGSPCVRYVVEKEIKKALKRMREKKEFWQYKKIENPEKSGTSTHIVYGIRLLQDTLKKNGTEGCPEVDGTFEYQHYIKHLYTCSG